MSAPEEGGEGTTPAWSAPSTMSLPKPPPSEHQRHWPLDLPSGLPFDRYEHRRLTARDILVHRIISKILFPSTGLSSVLDHPRKRNSTPKFIQHCCDYHKRESQNKTTPHHNFGPIKQFDRFLARDVEVLRKMLVTRSDGEWVVQTFFKPAKPARFERFLTFKLSQPSGGLVIPTCQPPDGSAVPTLEEEVLDLVQRYYMETDDACTRLWLQAVQPVQRSTYNTLPKQPAKRDTHKDVIQVRRRWDERNAGDDYKRWYGEDTAHLKALQTQTRTAGDYRLYEGGALLPDLRKPLFSSKVEREKFLHTVTEFSKRRFFTEEADAQTVLDKTFPWPEPAAPRRVMHIPSWYSWRQKHYFFRANAHQRSVPAFDFASGRTGRGLDRDGLWSTARWCGDDLPRGRTTRRGRRRATSEPPHGLFAAARLPISFNSNREILVFPKMSLSAIDRRARRRSLSRTRIAEMFNWDAVLEAPPPQKPAKMELVWKPTRGQQNSLYGDLVHGQLDMPEIETKPQRTGQQQFFSLYKDIIRNYKSGLISLEEVKETAWAVAPSSEARAGPWPEWWLAMGRLDDDFFDDEFDYTESQQVVNSVWNSSPLSPPCANCTSGEHTTDKCRSPCGYCGAPNPNMNYTRVEERRFTTPFPSRHDLEDEDQPSQAAKHDNPHLASNCPVARQNRCKCAPFPQFHVAAKCPALCSRDCGNHEHPPGHFRHKNAMSCKARCCMCGMKGHSGMKCKWRRCRCGGKHLGQDCGWHPECRAKGCDRFLCGVHCQVCGVARAQLEEGVGLVGRQCSSCVEMDDAWASAGVVVDSSSDLSSAEVVHNNKPQADEEANPGQKRRRRKNKRKHRSEGPRSPPEEKPWYAPLEPRTRPVASAKSGKRGTWDRAQMDLPVRIGGCR